MNHSSGLTAKQLEEYLYRSYTRLDGLWFVKTEERCGFDTALALDADVWRILPKIQARLLREQLGLSADGDGLARALTAKLTIDRYEFALAREDGRLALTLTRCPWHDLIVKSQRGHLAERIGGVICAIELPTFAREFGCAAGIPPAGCRLCADGSPCRFVFSPEVQCA